MGCSLIQCHTVLSINTSKTKKPHFIDQAVLIKKQKLQGHILATSIYTVFGEYVSNLILQQFRSERQGGFQKSKIKMIVDYVRDKGRNIAETCCTLCKTF